MNKTFISDKLKLDKLRHIKSFIHEMVSLEIERKFLSEQLPATYKESKMRYKTTTNYHTNSKNEKIKYKNTFSYILLDNSKSRVKKQEDIIIQLILERICEIDTKCEFLQKNIKLYCHSINSTKHPNELTWTLDILKASTEREIFVAKEHAYIFEKAQQFISGEINPKNAPELGNTNNNYYAGFCNEIYRSKNEVISAICLKKCGLSYCIEPTYPDSGMRADFGIFCSFCINDQGKTKIYKKPKQIFLEVAGKLNDEKYASNLSKKIKIAKEHKIPLLIIDCSSSLTSQNSQNSQNSPQCIFDVNYLSDIFTELYFGIRKANGEIILPYSIQ